MKLLRTNLKPINRLGWVPKESIGSQHFINGRCRARKEIKTNLMHKYNTGGKRGILGFLMYVQDDDLAGSDNINISAYKHTRRERERERETVMSEVHKVRLSRRSCMIKVLSLYDSSPNVSNSDIASSKACQI